MDNFWTQKKQQHIFNEMFQVIFITLVCQTPNRDGYLTFGPALSGTVCGTSFKKLNLKEK